MSEAIEADIKAEALAAIDLGASVNGTAVRLGLPETSVRAWAQGKRLQRTESDVASQRERFNSRFVERVEGRIDQALDSLPGKIETANFAQLCTGVGILIDKRQLLLGAPTSIVQHQTDPAELRAGLAAAAIEAGISYQDALEAAMAIAEETGDRELQRVLPTIIDVESLTE